MKRKWFPTDLTKGLPNILDALFVGNQDHHGWVFMDANEKGRVCVDALFPGLYIAWRAPCGDIVPANWRGIEINVPGAVAGLPETKLPLEITRGADLSKANPDALALLLALGVVRQGGCAAIIRNGGLEIFRLDDSEARRPHPLAERRNLMRTTKDERTELAHSLALLRARYDSGAVSPAIYTIIRQLENDLSWMEHAAREKAK